MATRSLIGRLRDDGTVSFVYCHSDGYLSHNGAILNEHYQDSEKVDQLLALGDLSVLGSVIGEKHDFGWYAKLGAEYTFDESLWSDEVKATYAKLRSYTRAYHRDRGEPLNLQVAASEDEFWQINQGTEYWYLFKGRQWFVKEYSNPPLLLAEALARDNAQLAAAE